MHRTLLPSASSLRRTLGIAITIACGAVFVGGCGAEPPQSVAKVVKGVLANDYPYPTASWTEADPWGFYKRECTSYVAFRMNCSTTGTTFSNYMFGVGNNLKDASNWAPVLSANYANPDGGATVDTQPREGDIAHWSTADIGGVGHVAFVEAVNYTNNTVTISEYNNNNTHEYSSRGNVTAPRYIHYKNCYSVTVTNPVFTSAIADKINIHLTWRNGTAYPDGTELQRSVDGGAFAVLTTVGAGVASYDDRSVTAGRVYKYRLRGIKAGTYSPTADSTSCVVLAAPTNLVAKLTSGSTASLTWSGATSVAGYPVTFQIWRSDNGGTYFLQFTSTTTSTTQYNLIAGTTYTYKVRATANAGDLSDFSNAAVAIGVPRAPSSLTATSVSGDGSKVDLRWADNSDNESSFEITRSGASAKTITVAANTTTYRDSLLTCGASYSYIVRAVNVAGYSTNSNTASVNTPGTCTIGTEQCIGSTQYLRCEADPAGGCPRQVSHYCVTGDCYSNINLCTGKCSNACTLGSIQCVSSTVYQKCVTGSLGCTQWASYGCAGGGNCYSTYNLCVGNCTNACTLNSIICTGPSSYQKCVTGSNGCTVWSSRSCAGGGNCYSSYNLCVGNCTNACTNGAISCTGSYTYRKCQVGSNGCTSWVSKSCAGGGNCYSSYNLCVGNCTNACTYGSRRCYSSTMYQTCVTGSSGCTVWGSATSCGLNQYCSSGTCSR